MFVKTGIISALLVLYATSILTACAVKPDNNYDLPPKLQKMAASANMQTTHEDVVELYGNAPFVKTPASAQNKS